MEISKKELKKISHSFHSVCNRLMQADFSDYEVALSKFIDIIDRIDLLHDFVVAQGETKQNVEKEVKEVCESYGQCIFSIGSTDAEEIRDVYAITKYVADNKLSVRSGYVRGYGHSSKYQDCTRAFNERFVMILIRHIEEYLVGLSIDMGLDENITYNISFREGQIIIAESGSIINATNAINSIDEAKLSQLIERIVDCQKECTTVSVIEIANLNDNLKELKKELLKPEPNKTVIQRITKTLEGLKFSTEFAAAITSLIQFVQTYNFN